MTILGNVKDLMQYNNERITVHQDYRPLKEDCANHDKYCIYYVSYIWLKLKVTLFILCLQNGAYTSEIILGHKKCDLLLIK